VYDGPGRSHCQQAAQAAIAILGAGAGGGAIAVLVLVIVLVVLIRRRRNRDAQRNNAAAHDEKDFDAVVGHLQGSANKRNSDFLRGKKTRQDSTSWEGEHGEEVIAFVNPLTVRERALENPLYGTSRGHVDNPIFDDRSSDDNLSREGLYHEAADDLDSKSRELEENEDRPPPQYNALLHGQPLYDSAVANNDERGYYRLGVALPKFDDDDEDQFGGDGGYLDVGIELGYGEVSVKNTHPNTRKAKNKTNTANGNAFDLDSSLATSGSPDEHTYDDINRKASVNDRQSPGVYDSIAEMPEGVYDAPVDPLSSEYDIPVAKPRYEPMHVTNAADGLNESLYGDGPQSVDLLGSRLNAHKDDDCEGFQETDDQYLVASPNNMDDQYLLAAPMHDDDQLYLETEMMTESSIADVVPIQV
jgi:hypothetical protein